ncbi:uncharacterized protein DEA37_0005469 [Paragonimus westermani]|uniref:Integrase catalytic domain-containing protein n=1 Tax=Paragonimus westermani TaxID=34504 RepID=A0A5J4NQ39_9TREM|nr:uncharacterized protein DEA37_0005469 [Paragonimus westermani]
MESFGETLFREINEWGTLKVSSPIEFEGMNIVDISLSAIMNRFLHPRDCSPGPDAIPREPSEERLTRLSTPHLTVHHRCLRSIARIGWHQRVRNEEVRKRVFGNRSVERTNRTIETLLQSFVERHQADRWDELVPRCTLAYRASIHTTTRYTPAYLTFGRKLRLPSELLSPIPPLEAPSPPDCVRNLRENLRTAFTMVQGHMKDAERRQKEQYDQHISGPVYPVDRRCTGLREDQYALLISSKRPFISMSSLFRDSCTPLKATLDPLLATPNKQKSVACKCSYKASKDVSAQIATVEKALNDTQRTLSNMKSELRSLNEYIALALPGTAAARKAVALSTAQIEEVATSLKDRALREKRLVLWGRFPTTLSPGEQAGAVLNACFPPESTKMASASRLRSKATKTSLGLLVTLPAKNSTEELLEKAVELKKKHVNLRGVSLDRSLQERQKRSQFARTRLCIKADPKLQASVKVLIPGAKR